MNKNLIKLFLRLAIGAGFISAAVDRFGVWPEKYTFWGDMGTFAEYTQKLNPWFPEILINPVAWIVTILEILLGLFLIIGYKIKVTALFSGILLLIFALAMTFSTGIKSAFDASVFSASAAAFALATMKNKFLEIR